MAETQFLLNLLAALSVGGATGYLGSLVVTKRMSLVGDALGHVALPGVALGILFGFNIIFGAFAALALGIIFIWLLEGKTTLPTEALTGIIFTGSLAAAFLLLPNEDLESALIGDISNSIRTRRYSSLKELTCRSSTRRISGSSPERSFPGSRGSQVG